MITAVGTTSVILNTQQFTQINYALQVIASAAQHQAFWNTQLFAALVGAAIGLFPFIYLLYLDRPRINVKVDHVWIAGGLGIVQSGISATISNAGRRSIIVEKVYLKFKDGSSLIFIDDKSFANGVGGLPKELRENTSHATAILAGTIARDLLKKQQYPIEVGFSDALGNLYRRKTSSKFWGRVFPAQETEDSVNETNS